MGKLPTEEVKKITDRIIELQEEVDRGKKVLEQLEQERERQTTTVISRNGALIEFKRLLAELKGEGEKPPKPPKALETEKPGKVTKKKKGRR